MDKIKALIFDLDYTLYPAECNINALSDEKINKYYIEKFGCRPEDVMELRRKFSEEYGDYITAVSKCGMDCSEFTDYICDVDVSSIPANPELNQLLKKIKLPKFIHTDSTHKHVSDSLKRLEVDVDFDGIFDVYDTNFVLKRQPEAYIRILAKINFLPDEVLLFEDNPKNIISAQGLGIKTVCIGPRESVADFQFADINQALKTLFNL